MTYQRKLWTSTEPIEILDSDDDLQIFGYSSVIDLTQDDLILPQAPPILQQPATKNKDCSTSSAADPSSHSRQLLELASREFSFVEGQKRHPPVKNETKASTLLVSPPGQVLQTGDDGFIEGRQQLMPEDDADSELSDVMDGSTQCRPRRVRTRKSRILDETHFDIPTSSSTVVRVSFPELADLWAERNHHHHGKIIQGIWIRG